MVEQTTRALDTVFHALGDATRRGMLATLASGERTVGELAQPYSMSLAAASKHIRTLENAGLVRRQVRGRTHVCRLEAGPLAEAQQWLKYYERFWNERLDVGVVGTNLAYQERRQHPFGQPMDTRVLGTAKLRF